eukprot:TRINITY_DN80434_c0_g1_i1.p1 TRINITY_DN80434_c0_g1~~TRINITY_DN80434_c0_g1_i1.p1  ORF type:complete len:639 (+),score=64.06 TRINITY_DN80434_c0_g1_i1:144-2060(+)
MLPRTPPNGSRTSLPAQAPHGAAVDSVFNAPDPFRRGGGLPRTPPSVHASGKTFSRHVARAEQKADIERAEATPIRRGGLPRTPPTLPASGNPCSRHVAYAVCDTNFVEEETTGPSSTSSPSNASVPNGSRGSPPTSHPAVHPPLETLGVRISHATAVDGISSTPDPFGRVGLPRTPPSMPASGRTFSRSVAHAEHNIEKEETTPVRTGGLPRTPPGVPASGKTFSRSVPHTEYSANLVENEETSRFRHAGLPRTPPSVPASSRRTVSRSVAHAENYATVVEKEETSTFSPPSSFRGNARKQPRRNGSVPPKTVAHDEQETSAQPEGNNLVSTIAKDGLVYVERRDLEAFQQQPPRLADLLKGLRGTTEDWAIQFAALEKLRRLNAHHPQTLAGEALHSVVELVLQHTMSLRSAVAKCALRCAGELFDVLCAALDRHVHGALEACLRRATDTNHFISEEAEHTLEMLCSSASVGKLVAPLLEHSQNKNAHMRAKAAKCMGLVVPRLLSRAGPAASLAHSLKSAIDRTSEDASLEVRQAARNAAAKYNSCLAMSAHGSHLQRPEPSPGSKSLAAGSNKRPQSGASDNVMHTTPKPVGVRLPRSAPLATSGAAVLGGRLMGESARPVPARASSVKRDFSS